MLTGQGLLIECIDRAGCVDKVGFDDLVNGHSVLFPHLIEFVDANDTAVGQHHCTA